MNVSPDPVQHVLNIETRLSLRPHVPPRPQHLNTVLRVRPDADPDRHASPTETPKAPKAQGTGAHLQKAIFSLASVLSPTPEPGKNTAVRRSG